MRNQAEFLPFVSRGQDVIIWAQAMMIIRGTASRTRLSVVRNSDADIGDYR